MLSVLTHTWRHHDHVLLLLAAAIWVCGSFSLFMLLQRSFEFGLRRRRQWIAIGAMTGGIGVWATHFVAMLAHHEHMPIDYDPGLTAFSIAEVIAFFWLALRIFISRDSLARQVLAGAVAVGGVAMMHFTGMAAIQSAVEVHYASAPVIWAGAIAALTFIGAFLLFARTRGKLQIVAPASLSIVSVCALHFTVMAGTTITLCDGAAPLHGAINRTWLITAIVVAASLLVVATALALLLDRYLSDLNGLANATLEGIVIVQGDQIVEVNDRFAIMLGAEARIQMPNLAETVGAILEETGFPAHRLELEITETVLMKDRDSVLLTLNRLKQSGVRIVMDDFGTGYSSLSNLQSFPFDKLKIDRSFIGAMEDDAAARSIIRAIVGIGRSLSLPVVAEGVETETQHRMVIEEGCLEAQGYLFGRPARMETRHQRTLRVAG